MRRGLAWPVLVACALEVGPGVVRAQSPVDLLAAGVRAYTNLEFDLAAGLLRREIARLGDTATPDTTVTKALVYLGAAELFGGRRDSAAAVFRRLVILDPRYRPDGLIFPPEVTTVFDAVRQDTKAALVAVPRDTTIVPGAGSFRGWVVASSFHVVEVTLRYEDGALFRRLYNGPLADSLTVEWDGLDPVGQPPAVDGLLLRVASHGSGSQPVRILQLSLALRVTHGDTLAWPAAPTAAQLLPERAAPGPARRAFLGGVLLSAGVVGLPALVGGSETSSGPRIAVAGTVGLAGVLGYVLHRPGRPLDANVRANQAVRDAWQRRLVAVKEENARVFADVRLAIRAGEPTILQARRP